MEFEHKFIILKHNAQEIKNYFEQNDNCGVSCHMVWDVMKAVIRGKAIAITTSYKKEKQKLWSDLLSSIKNLEAQHKVTCSVKIYKQLLVERKKLEALEGSTKHLVFEAITLAPLVETPSLESAANEEGKIDPGDPWPVWGLGYSHSGDSRSLSGLLYSTSGPDKGHRNLPKETLPNRCWTYLFHLKRF